MPTSNTSWGNQTHVLSPEDAAAGGYTMGDAGYYLTSSGDVAPGQVTPGMRDNPDSQVFYDNNRDLNYFQKNGQRIWISPGVDPTTGVQRMSNSGGSLADRGGGLVHGNPQWNPQTGSWDVGLDWGKIMSWAVGAGLGAGVVAAAAAGGTTTAATVGTTAGTAAPAAGTGAAAAGTGAGIAGGTAIPTAGTGAMLGIGGGTTAVTTGGAAIPTAGTGAMLGIGGGTTPVVAGTAAAGTGLSTYQRIAQGLGAAGRGLGQAATAEGQNLQDAESQRLRARGLDIDGQDAFQRQLLNQARFGLDANGQNITGENAYQDNLISRANLGLNANAQNIQGEGQYNDDITSRAQLGINANNSNISGEAQYRGALENMAGIEGQQRRTNRMDVFRGNYFGNPATSEFNTRPQQYSQDFLNTMGSLARQGSEELQQAPKYSARTMPEPKAYTPYSVGNLPAPKPYTPYKPDPLPELKPYTPYMPAPMPAPIPYTPYQPGPLTSTTTRVANWLTPTLSTLGTIGEMYYGGKR